jgi:signal transduction histidine kinase
LTPARSPTFRLLAGLAITLTAVAVYSGYTVHQLRNLRELQAGTMDRNRRDSLLLLRIQNSLNLLAIAMRDMLDSTEPYPLSAWRTQFQRIHDDLADALKREEQFSPVEPRDSRRSYLASSFAQFWTALDRVFVLADSGQEAEARAQIRISLQSRQAALSTAVARLLVQGNEAEEQATVRAGEIYRVAERNVYIFQGSMLVLILLTSLYLVHSNRRMFEQVAAISKRRGELSRQLISMQENAFRSISRDLHDDFGQILTAIGAMLRKPNEAALQEVRGIVQETLEKVRSLSHALHPVALEEAGLESAMESYLPSFERQHGIKVRYEKTGISRDLEPDAATHLYRVMQEALNNTVRHSGSRVATVRLKFLKDSVILEVEDEGIGFGSEDRRGLGLISMRERAELMSGRLDFLRAPGNGALVRITAPTPAVPVTNAAPSEEAHA